MYSSRAESLGARAQADPKRLHILEELRRGVLRVWRFEEKGFNSRVMSRHKQPKDKKRSAGRPGHDYQPSSVRTASFVSTASCKRLLTAAANDRPQNVHHQEDIRKGGEGGDRAKRRHHQVQDGHKARQQSAAAKRRAPSQTPPTSNPVTGDVPSFSTTSLAIRRRASSSEVPAVVRFHAAARSRAEKLTQWEEACPHNSTLSRAHSFASSIRPRSLDSSPTTGTSAAKQLLNRRTSARHGNTV